LTTGSVPDGSPFLEDDEEKPAFPPPLQDFLRVTASRDIHSRYNLSLPEIIQFINFFFALLTFPSPFFPNEGDLF